MTQETGYRANNQPGSNKGYIVGWTIGVAALTALLFWKVLA
jgi:hypothetical protein